MKTFPTLYKRTKTGAIQYWQIKTVSCPSHTIIHKESGQLGTENPVTHDETLTAGKNIGRANETTHEQQADLQAESDWRKKHDEGYKSAEDLGILTKDIDPVGYNFTVLLEKALPKFNTGVGNIPMPMLATDWTKVKSITYPCYIQPKLDGVRCLMVVSRQGPDLDVVFLSRNGKEYTTLEHIREDVLENSGSDPFILDGEIYSHELTFQEITAAVKKQRPESLKLHFRAYDIITDSSQQARAAEVIRIVDYINSPFISAVPTQVIQNKNDVKQMHDQYVQEGYEGAMLRLFDGMYAQGQRSRHLLKVKEFDETEFAFHSFEHGQRLEDLIAVCLTDNQKPFRAKMQGSKEQKQQLEDAYKAGNLEGLMLTVKHFGWTDDGLPRFPIGKAFREDLS